MDLSPLLVDETKFFPVLSRMVECLGQELAAAHGPDLCYRGLMIGDVTPLALMDCAKGCGVAWVRPAGAFPSTALPAPADPTIPVTAPLGRWWSLEGQPKCSTIRAIPIPAR